MMQLAVKNVGGPIILKTWDELTESTLSEAIKQFIRELDLIGDDNDMCDDYFLCIEGVELYFADLLDADLLPEDLGERLPACMELIEERRRAAEPPEEPLKFGL